MEQNVGGTDRIARIAVGVFLAAVSMAVVAFGDGFETATRGAIAALSLLVGGILLGTAGARKCPINALLGRNTSDD